MRPSVETQRVKARRDVPRASKIHSWFCNRTITFTRLQELMDALMVTLGLAEGRMEMWALNGNPFEEGDDTNAGVLLHLLSVVTPQ